MTSLNCEVCFRRRARYVCQECGRKVCERCVNPWNWTCLGCRPTSSEREETAETYSSGSPPSLGLLPYLLTLGFMAIFAGMTLVFLAVVLGGVPSEGSGFFFIWPFPLIFGFGSGGDVQSAQFSIIAVMAVFLMLVLVAVFLWLGRLPRWFE
ncbi:hypothetical protein [Candidatus Hecatella orcuttiae]|uniref:B-box zinc finger protein n=1 Tax=Candidatus Hecatella orcuttiae TaxID=1935119 RepID=UPI0028680485|nr:hypothetical protein [Candidatus Hecatella orcuttiae]